MDRRRLIAFLILLFTGALLVWFSMKTRNEDSKVNIGRSDIRIEDGVLTPEVLWSMGRIGGVAVSPDGSRIAYQVSYYSVKENASHTVIYVMNDDGSDVKLLTKSAVSEHSPAWIENDHIAFLSVKNGVQQIFSMDSDGKNRKQLSFGDKDIEGFLFSPDMQNVLVVKNVPNPLVKEKQYEDLPKASGMIADDLMFRHWDSWVTSLPHPYVAAFDGKRVADECVDLLEGEPFESPMLPFGGMEQFAWSPDGKSVAYTCRKKAGAEYTKSTDSDIYLYNIETGKVRNLCKLSGTEDKNMGYDTNPKFNSDGRYIA